MDFTDTLLLCEDKVEGEHHFLLFTIYYFSLNEEIRNNFFQKRYKIMREDIQLWCDTDKIKYLFNTTDKSFINCFGNLVLISLKTLNTHRKGN